MKFLTGSEMITPLGAPQKYKVYFKHNCTSSTAGVKCHCYPTVSTCAFHLTLPVHITSDTEMKEMFVLALEHDFGFGRC